MDFIKKAHLIEQSEMMVLPKYFLAKSEFRKIAHIDYIIFLWRGWEILKFESLSLSGL